MRVPRGGDVEQRLERAERRVEEAAEDREVVVVDAIACRQRHDLVLADQGADAGAEQTGQAVELIQRSL